MNRLILGVQPVREALRAHAANVLWIALQSDTPRLDGLRSLAESLGVEVRNASRFELDRLSRGEYHQGVAAEAPPLRLVKLDKLLAGQAHPVILALDGIQDPQNFGATVRSAVGLNRSAILWGENSSAPLTATTFRASAGAIEHATLCRTPSLTAALQAAVAAGYQVLGLDGHAEKSLGNFTLSQPTVIVVGNEGKGIGKGVRRQCTDFARVASPDTVDSLNASVAAALALYEVCRQRGVL
jgi:23S rRNA (guanosine2251-2'-O)-methyltransferase